MKDDLISRRFLIEAFKEEFFGMYSDDFNYMIKWFENLPTANCFEYFDKLWKIAYERGKRDAHPKGNWIPIKNTRLVECECGFITDRLCEYNFCPNCGARMEES